MLKIIFCVYIIGANDVDLLQEQLIIKRAEQLVKDALKHDSTGHDWWHIVRVQNLAKEIGRIEECNLFICELAALLHDLADDKLVSDEKAALESIEHWLFRQGISKEERYHIMDIVENMSFKGGNQPTMNTIEGKVVQDADRLDAIGAIGIGRVFSYSGAKGQLMYDPSIAVREVMTQEEYRKSKSTAINHFYEKLFKLKDLMNTNTGKKIAIERHLFMEKFIEQFFSEWGLKGISNNVVINDTNKTN